MNNKNNSVLLVILVAVFLIFLYYIYMVKEHMREPDAAVLSKLYQHDELINLY